MPKTQAIRLRTKLPSAFGMHSKWGQRSLRLACLSWLVTSVALMPFLLSKSAEAQDDVAQGYEIRLETRSFTPDATITTELKQHLRSMLLPRAHALVQFKKPLSPKMMLSLRRANIQLAGYLGGTAYHVSIPQSTDLAQLDLARWLRFADVIRSDDKISPRLTGGKVEEWAQEPSTGRLRILIDFFPDVTIGEARGQLAALGVEAQPYGAPNSWAGILAEHRLSSLARLDGVRFIEPGPFLFVPLNSDSRRVTRTDGTQLQKYDSAKPTYDGVGGEGARIGISDYTSIDETHPDFHDLTSSGTPGNSRLYTIRAGYQGNHATATASVASGNGVKSTDAERPAFSLRGHAPEAELGDYPDFHGSRDLNYFAIVDDGTDVTNHSYAEGCPEHYSVTSAGIDAVINGNATDSRNRPIPARPQVWAAGNNQLGVFCLSRGYYSVATAAKNSISVGSVDASDERLSEFSSLGPTFDGRLKPDLVAPGCYDSTERGLANAVGLELADAGTEAYTRFGTCGTSLAAPAVTGIIALLMERYRSSSPDDPELLPSTYKALLIETARDLVKTTPHATGEIDNVDTKAPLLYHAGPDYATGHGLVDATAAAELIASPGRWREAEITRTGFSDSWCVSVAPGSAELKVTLAWDDEPANPQLAFDAPKLVNDLDLIVRQPSDLGSPGPFGLVYRPWVLDPLPFSGDPFGFFRDPIGQDDARPARRREDHLNNVEVVSVPRPRPGTWLVKVTGHSLPNGNSQSYSLASSHEFLPREVCSCTLFPEGC